MPQTLSGVVERVVFHNPETGFAVLRVEVKGRRELATVVGVTPAVNPGEFIDAEGQWVRDRDHGDQFKADELRFAPPSSKAGIEKFLGSGLIKGVGPHYAKKIVEAFGERTLQVIDSDASFLAEVKGIGPKRIARIRASWQEQKAVRDILIFLQQYGVGIARAVRIHRTYGDQAVERVKENPYRLATDIWGIGFKTADELAGQLGIDRQSPQRARAALRYTLTELGRAGHVGYPESAVVEKVAELTGIDTAIIERAIESEREADEVIRDSGGDVPWLYLKGLYLAETGAARTLRRLSEGAHPLGPIDTAAALGWVEKQMGIALAPAQREAIAQATREKVLVVTGGPGTGKTTLVRGILEIFAAKKLRVALCAPTGRAAKRLAESTGREAKTIHRLLEFLAGSGSFARNPETPLDADLIVADEASMIDMPLMHHLVRAIRPGACLVLVGDVDQLPSVGPGRVLGDVIASRALPVVRLTSVFRQAEQSWIVRAAHAVNRGELPQSAPAADGDFFFIEADTPDAILERVVVMLRERIRARFRLDPLRDVQVLTPMNRSDLGTQALNQRLQALLNPDRGGPFVERFGSVFRVGDKVLQTQNDYEKEVFNGDIGRVRAIEEQERELTVDFDGKDVDYDFGELDELALAYALTIHKSQGSEYPAVIIPLHTQHYLMLQRNLLYTGITRGKRLVAIVGSKQALEIAVRRQDMSQRCSALERRLSEPEA